MEPHRLYVTIAPVPGQESHPLLSGEDLVACGVACLLVSLDFCGDEEKEKIFCTLARPLQAQGIACLVAGEPEFCLRVKADGVHVDGEGLHLENALRMLKPDYIVGAGGIRTRHAAMVAGETGVDYVMFGESGEPLSSVIEQVAWWAEIFTVPCVAYANDLQSIGSLVRAGADFVALGPEVLSGPRGTNAALREAAALAGILPEAAR